jgi:hypothetical protein
MKYFQMIDSQTHKYKTKHSLHTQRYATREAIKQQKKKKKKKKKLRLSEFELTSKSIDSYGGWYSRTLGKIG